MAITVSYEVELHAFGEQGQTIRTVDIPLTEVGGIDCRRDLLEVTRDILGLIFHYGQNDFQPKPVRSVSVGDIVRLAGERFVVKGIGWMKVPADWQTPTFTHGGRLIAEFESGWGLTRGGK